MENVAIKIRTAKPEDAGAWNHLRTHLWPDGDHREAIAAFFAGKAREPVAVFVAEQADGSLAGFAEVSIRHDYVEGAVSSLVAYLEGWFVEPGSRGRHVGKNLVEFAGQWAAALGFIELGSNALIENESGIQAHQACGFLATGTTIHFIKSLT